MNVHFKWPNRFNKRAMEWIKLKGASNNNMCSDAAIYWKLFMFFFSIHSSYDMYNSMFIEENTSLPIKFNNIEIKSRPQAQREWKKGPHIWQCCSACQPNDTCTCPLVVRVFLQCIMLRLCHWWTYGCVCFGWFSLLWALLYCRLRYSCCVMCVVCVCVDGMRSSFVH